MTTSSRIESDGGVGHLREALLEVVVEHPRLVRERRQLRVVAHGSERVAAVTDQAQEHELHGLGRIAEGPHALEHGRLVVAVRIVGLAQFQTLSRQPFPVRALFRPLGLELVVRHQASGIEVDEEEPARMQPALRHYPLRRDRQHAHFRGHDAAVVVGHVVAARAQPVAVEHGADAVAVGEGDQGRAVPGLHQARLEFVEGALVGRHVGPLLPRLGDHGHDRLGQAAPGHEQELEHVVEVARVRAVGLDDGEELLQLLPEQLRAQYAFARVHPVAVAQQRVDLAVVAHGAVGLGRSHEGKVFVEKRECTIAMWDS